MAFAQELKNVYDAKKAEFLEKREENLERRVKDITLFFEKEVREHAKERMRARAEQGRPTANILEYHYNERFYVEDDNIVKYVDKEVNKPNYRIHDVVTRDRVFQGLLNDFEKEISSDETPIQISKWHPRDSLYVIEAVWGKNRYHRNDLPHGGFTSTRGRGRAGPRRQMGGRGYGRGNISSEMA
jgi:hypothetical protein